MGCSRTPGKGRATLPVVNPLERMSRMKRDRLALAALCWLAMTVADVWADACILSQLAAPTISPAPHY
jgi:hypothetical protein